MSQTETRLPLNLNFKEFPVFPMDTYNCILSKVEVTERTPYKKTDKDPKEPCIRFAFSAYSEIDKDGNATPLVIDDNEVMFSVVTGFDYGGKKATITKLINGVLGRELSKEELPSFDVYSLEGKRVKLAITVEETKDNKEKNSIAGYQAIK